MSIAPTISMPAVGPIDRRGVRARSVSGGWSRARVLVPLLVVVIPVVAYSGYVRWSIASTLPWQCDEIALLQRFTALSGVATTEAQAQQFEPSLYSLRMGALRSLRVPSYNFSVHTTTGFWTNLSIHLFGYSTAAGRAPSLFWSLLGAVGVAWATWLVSRSAVASMVAVWLLALSPYSIAYGTQVRGYAEALALTPLLLVFLERFREHPQRWLRPTLLFLCAMQLSLTVYTMWLYWVGPVVLLAIFLLPCCSKTPERRQFMRSMLIVMLCGLVATMIVFTASRWQQLTLTAGAFGAQLSDSQQIAAFVMRMREQLLSWPGIVVALSVVGAVVLWRSKQRWWLAAIAVGVAVPALFAAVHGSLGYVRNVGFLLAPAVILAGLGANAVFGYAIHRWNRPAVIGAVAALTLSIFSVQSLVGLETRARTILMPDWGDAVLAANDAPTPYGPRWFCRCLANYWQIDWYREAPNPQTFIDLAHGETLEVVMGARLDPGGRSIVYHHDLSGGGIREETIPAYLESTQPTRVRSGVEIRRWVATRITSAEGSSLDSQEPVFVLAKTNVTDSVRKWINLLGSDPGFPGQVMAWRTATIEGGRVESMIAPAGCLKRLLDGLESQFDASRGDVRVFHMTLPGSSPTIGA